MLGMSLAQQTMVGASRGHSTSKQHLLEQNLSHLRWGVCVNSNCIIVCLGGYL